MALTNNNLDLTQKEYDIRVQHNTDLVLGAVLNDKSIYSILPYIATLEHGIADYIHDLIIKNNINDIIPSLYLGILPTTKGNGFDAIELADNHVTEFELKFATIHMSQVWMKDKGTLYTGRDTGSQCVALGSRLSGKFVLHSAECRASKNRETILMVSDLALPNHAVMSYRLSGPQVIEMLNRSTNPKRDVKLRTFLKGEECKHVHKTINWDQYTALLQNHVDYLEDWKEHNGDDYDVAAFQAAFKLI